MIETVKTMLKSLKADVKYYECYKYGLYAFIMENYRSTKLSEKIAPEFIIELFKEITSIDNQINYLYRIIRSHDP